MWLRDGQIKPTGPSSGSRRSANFRSLLPPINGMTLPAIMDAEARSKMQVGAEQGGAGARPRAETAFAQSRRPS